MGSDILVQHKQLTKELDEARLKLQQAEKALFDNELKMLKAIKENPLMQHIGLQGPESDLSDYLGSEFFQESKPTMSTHASSEIFSCSLELIDPLLAECIQEDPIDTFFSAHPCLDILDELGVPIHTETDGKLQEKQQKFRINNYSLDAENLSALAPEDSLRATLALASIGVGIWDWDALNGTVYTCPYWQDLIGIPEENSDPIRTLTSALDPDSAKNIEKAIISLSDGTNSSFCIRINTKPEPSVNKWVELHGICVRNAHKALLRIVISAIDVSYDHTFGLDLKRCLKSLESSSKGKPDFLFKVGKDYKILDVNALSSYYFSLKEEAIGKFLHEVISDNDAYFFEKHIQKTITSRTTVSVETKLWSPFTGSFTAECTFIPISTESDTSCSNRHSVSTVSVEVKDLTRALRMVEEYYALFNNTSEGYALFKYDTPNSRISEEVAHINPSSRLRLIAMNPALRKIVNLAQNNPFIKTLSDLYR